MTPIQSFRKKLQQMQARAFAFNKLNLAASADYFKVEGADGKETTLDQVLGIALNSSEDDQKVMMKMLEGFRGGNQEDRVALQELRMVNIELFVRAMSNFGLFFNSVTLKDNEQSVYVHSYKNPVNVKHIAQDGHIGTMKAVKAQKQVYVDMREISAEVGYQIRDVNLGTDVVAAANATVDVAWDIENKIDYEAFKMLINGGVFAPFVTKKNGASDALSATFIPHWRINTTNLPTTNDIVLSGATATRLNATPNGTGGGQSNNFRYDVIVAAIDYCASFANIFGGPLDPTGAILIPSSDVSGLARDIKPTTLFFNEVAEGALKDYRIFEYQNKKWVLIPDVTLTPGCCYLPLNRPVGDKITKPSLDWEDIDTNRKKNWETRTSNKTLQYFVPEPSRVNALRVTYSDQYQDPILK